MNEVNKTYPTFGIVVINPEDFKTYKEAGYEISNGFINRLHLLKQVTEISVDKYELLRKIVHCVDHYVAPIVPQFPCVTNSELNIQSGIVQFDLNVDRYINVNLSNIFKEEKQTYRRGFIGSESFTSICLGASWFWFMETKDVGMVGMRAFVLHTTIQCEHFHLSKDNVLTFSPAGRPENDAVSFVHYVANAIKNQLNHQRTIQSQTSVRKFDANLYHPRRNINIALDFDGTVTSDYYGFTAMAEMLRERGHKVYLVTMRYRSECVRDKTFMDLVEKVDGFIHTDRQSKKPYCEANGIKIHVWIDDNPEAVNKSAVQIWGTASPEGSIVIEEHGSENHN